MSKTISVSLSEKSFRDASKEILKYKKEIIAKCRMFAERLAERGVEIAQMKIQSQNAVYTGELWASIQKTPGMVLQYGSTYIVYTDCPWAKYVEFGTGITGSQNPHPNASVSGWKYDVNEHGESGWFYYRDGEWHWTKGMPSRPFMYETDLDLILEISKIAKEVFGNG